MAVALPTSHAQAAKAVLKRAVKWTAPEIAAAHISAAQNVINRTTTIAIKMDAHAIRLRAGTTAPARADTNTRRRTMAQIMLHKVPARFNFLS